MGRAVFAPLFFCATLVSAQTEPLRDDSKTWLEQDVGYIITEVERELFVSLETQQERDQFITAFWAKRDPNLVTPDNEFRDEHYRRLAYANEYLGRESFSPGWRTDRGRYYIILGEPRTIQRFYGQNSLKETELWFFQNQDGRGLPAFFYLLFFKRDEVGDYRLYHPLIDGPGSLLRGTDISPHTDNLTALAKLEEINAELASASLSLDAGNPPDFLTGRPASGVDALLARIEESPKRAINTGYIEGWRRYTGVYPEYSFNFVPNRHVFAVMAGPEATSIVHYSIELDPASFGLETDEHQSKFYTTLEVTVEVRNDDQVLVHSTTRSTFIELTRQQMEDIQTSPIAYQDDFPLVPGKYAISVVMRNRALKNYTVAEADIEIADLKTMPAIVDVIVCRDSTISTEAIGTDEVRTFQYGPLRLEPAAANLFAIGDTVTVFAQALSAPEGAKTSFELVSRDVVLDRDTGSLTGQLSTLGLDSGTYQVRVRLITSEDDVIAEKRVELTLSPRTQIPRPAFVYRRGFNTTTSGLLALVRGDQLWRLGRYEEAQKDFEAAVAAGNPDLPQARWKLATAHLRTGNADDALTLLAPMEELFRAQFEVSAGLGSAYYLKGDYDKSVRYLERSTAIRPPDTSTLNALGDAHQRLGNHDKAIVYFERSLELDPDQGAVNRRLENMQR